MSSVSGTIVPEVGVDTGMTLVRKLPRLLPQVTTLVTTSYSTISDRSKFKHIKHPKSRPDVDTLTL